MLAKIKFTKIFPVFKFIIRCEDYEYYTKVKSKRKYEIQTH